jgi:hypothetical protein
LLLSPFWWNMWLFIKTFMAHINKIHA